MNATNPWGLGLPKGLVLLVDHNPEWRQAFAAESVSIRTALGPAVIDVQHIGSTAIPTIRAKPILDIMLGIADLDQGPSLAPALAGIGYEFVANAGVPNHVFGKSQPRTHLLHVVAHDSPKWHRNLRFRDRLLADPGMAKAYENLKARLAVEFADNRAAYTDGKAQFIDAAVA